MVGPTKSHICSLSDFSWDQLSKFPGNSPTKSHVTNITIKPEILAKSKIYTFLKKLQTNKCVELADIRHGR